MSAYIDALVAPMLLIACLSHASQPKLWAEFFRVLTRTGVAPLIIGMYTLPIGLLVVVGHNRWAWDWPVMVTVAGWGMTLKSILYMIVPGVSERMLARADRCKRGFGVFRVVGLVGAVPCAVLTWQAFRHLPA
ncbi:hypothetical protein [Aquisphaera insulae]|uniref:hypothetical protein n=1 Tax=Aquisphaera insulae TaxID=2712864 RepID=UPI0013ED33DB|nr:hypothetical protein [Aquisphaera insulae]